MGARLPAPSARICRIRSSSGGSKMCQPWSLPSSWGELGDTTLPTPAHPPEAEKYLAGEEGLTRERLSSSGPGVRPIRPRASRCRVLPMTDGSLSKSGQLRVPSLDGQHTRLQATGQQGEPRGRVCIHTQPKSHHTWTCGAAEQTLPGQPHDTRTRTRDAAHARRS